MEAIYWTPGTVNSSDQKLIDFNKQKAVQLAESFGALVDTYIHIYMLYNTYKY